MMKCRCLVFFLMWFGVVVLVILWVGVVWVVFLEWLSFCGLVGDGCVVWGFFVGEGML